MSKSIDTNIQPTLSKDWVITGKDNFNLVNSIALPILILGAAAAAVTGIALHFSLRMPPMTHITSNFSMSTPLLVGTVSGIACPIMLMVHLHRRKKECKSWGKLVGKLIFNNKLVDMILSAKNFDTPSQLCRLGLYPNGRESYVTVQTVQTHLSRIGLSEKKSWNWNMRVFKMELVEFDTSDGVTLRGFWMSQNKNAPTAIVFHGNGMNAEDMLLHSFTKHYEKLGFNIFIPEIRGYGISDGEAATEMQAGHAALDAQAALKFLIDKGVDKDTILAHGWSLGGAYAAELDVPKVLVQTFTSFADVAHNITNNIATVRKTPLLKLFLLNSFMQGVTEAASQYSFKAVRYQIDGKFKTTDGFNNTRKVAACQKDIFAVIGGEDFLMAKKFGHRMMKANYPKEKAKRKQRLAILKGAGHCEVDEFFNSKKGHLQKFETFLKEIKFLEE